MSKRISYVCDLCGRTIPTSSSVHQIYSSKCTQVGGCLNAKEAMPIIDVCGNCIDEISQAIKDYKKKPTMTEV